jgi:FAD/FMN-containing dehydrogenase
MPSRERRDIAHALGLRIDRNLIEEDRAECDRKRDDTPPSSGFLRTMFSREPDVVVFPDSGQCVADIIDVCIEERTPAVPRGTGGAGLGGAMPMRGGVVIDLSRMDRIVSLDRDRLAVTAEAGCTWERLEEKTASEGLTVAAYPPERERTVGGWLSTGGLGVGTLATGPFHLGVESLEVAVPSGILVNAGHGSGRYSIESLAGTEGQLGIVTRLTFPVVRKPGETAYRLVGIKTVGDGVELLKALSAFDPSPLGIRLVSSGFAGLLLGRQEEQGTGRRPVLATAFRGGEAEVRKFDEMLKRRVSGLGVEISGDEEARAAFETQMTQAETGVGKTIMRSGEVLVGLDVLAGLVGGLEKDAKGGMLWEAQVVARDRALAAVWRLVDAPGLPRVVRDVPMTVRVSERAVRSGGVPYGIGIWNTPFAGKAMGPARKELRVIKDETDRIKILNPGKFFEFTTSSGLPVWRPAYQAGMRLLGLF